MAKRVTKKKAVKTQTPSSAFKHIESAHGVSSYVLKQNGLSVLVMPKHELPVVGTMITYHVGSRHELPGHTGATHILEHLMFKGSKKFDPKKGKGIWHLLEKKGAQGNATTWCDRTNYYWVSPLNLVEDAVEIEADRMRNLFLRPKDLASEMTVVRNEFERGENDPQHRLGKHAWFQAFTLHPYRIPTIGTREDIEETSVEKLRRFYDAFYWPNNATVTVVGDIKVPDALELVRKKFGAIPSRTIIEPDFLHEPHQEGERRFALKRKGTVNAVMLCFKAPAGLAKDSYAVSLASAVLGEGKSSLLYQALVDTGLAVDVHVDYPRFKDPSLVEVYATLTERATHEQIEKEILRILERLSVDGPTEKEFERASAYVEAEYLYAASSVSGTLAIMNEAIARGDWKDAWEFTRTLQHVTKAEVRDALKKYFTLERATVGYLRAV